MSRIFMAPVLGLALFTTGAFAEELTGYISDSHCGAKHDTVSAANTKCINACLKGGSNPVLVSEGKVINIDAESRDKAVAHAGQKVKIDGTMNGDTVKIDSIEESK